MSSFAAIASLIAASAFHSAPATHQPAPAGPRPPVTLAACLFGESAMTITEAFGNSPATA